MVAGAVAIRPLQSHGRECSTPPPLLKSTVVWSWSRGDSRFQIRGADAWRVPWRTAREGAARLITRYLVTAHAWTLQWPETYASRVAITVRIR